jgi:hypothetical protein
LHRASLAVIDALFASAGAQARGLGEESNVLKKFKAFSPDFMREGRGPNPERDRRRW